MKKNIALVMGGYSGEHDISINSGNQVYEQLDHSKYNVVRIVIEREGWYALLGEERVPVDKNDFSVRGQRFDLAFIIVHGNPGENGVLQGYFDMLHVPYTTCGFYTSALTFNKGYCNPVVQSFGVANVAKSHLISSLEQVDETMLIEELGLPLFVKPASGGSSVATSKVKTRKELLPAIKDAFTEDSQVLVEQFIKGREIDCGVLRTKEKKLVFPITEIIPTGGHEFFDFEAKYQGFSEEVTPAQVPDWMREEIQQTSSKLYDLLNCKGLVRFDFIYDTERSKLFFLEVNTIPGQSAESIVPKQARAMGISPKELYEMVIQACI